MVVARRVESGIRLWSPLLSAPRSLRRLGEVLLENRQDVLIDRASHLTCFGCELLSERSFRANADLGFAVVSHDGVRYTTATRHVKEVIE
jgi:hypothetical protein